MFVFRHKWSIHLILTFALIFINSRAGWSSSVSIPDATVQISADITIPIITSDLTGLGIVCYDCVLEYDHNLLEFKSFEQSNTLSSGLIVVINDTTNIGELIISAAGSQSINGSGVLLYLKFRTKTQPGQALVSFKSFYYTGHPGEVIIYPATTDGTISIDGAVSVESSDNPFNLYSYNPVLYPNPFNSAITIKYRLPSAQKIMIGIYNLNGRKVKTLINEIQGAGEHFIRWDGYTDSNIRAASGVYFCRITFSNRAKIIRITYIK